jgi:RNA polymerase sigma-70 factor (ECF subfamily)
MENFNNPFFIRRIQKGDSDAFTTLVNTYYEPLCNYIFSLTKNSALAEDIVQDVFTQVWVNRKKLNPKKSVRNYLYTLTYNQFIDYYRKRKPMLFLEKKHLDALEHMVEMDPIETQELLAKINREIEKLPPKCKEIFILNKREGLTHTEISTFLNVSVKTVEGHISRAFKTLNQKLKEETLAVFFMLFGFRTGNG